MFAKKVKAQGPRSAFRKAVAAVEFAFFLPVVFLVLCGLWEYGQAVSVQNVMVNCAREGARDASLGTNNLATVASNVLSYLQSAEPIAFGSGHTITQTALSNGSNGYSYWDSTENRQLFTITFTDVTNSSVTDPTGMSQLDHYQITITTPYSTIGWLPVSYFTGLSNISARVDWVCLCDSPFTITGYLSAQ